MNKRNYIGLATTCHDPAIAIINAAGELVFAEATERYLQNKRAWNAIPDDVIRMEKLVREYCDPGADLVIANSWDRKFIKGSKIVYPLLRWGIKRAVPAADWYAMDIVLRGMISISHTAGTALTHHFLKRFPEAVVKKTTFNHHLTHAAYACYSSPFEDAVCAVMDSYGEDSSTGFFHYHKGTLKPLPIKRSTASLGHFYSMICELCGFGTFKGEEWKVMGMAPYGKFDKDIYEILRSAIAVTDCRFTQRPNHVKFMQLIREAYPPQAGKDAMQYADLAHTAQFLFNELVTEMATNLHKRGLSDNLIIGGGCGLNSVCNGKLVEATPFKRVHVPCAPADDGNAVGAAALAYYKDHPASSKISNIRSPYLGSTISKDALGRLKRFSKFAKHPSSGKDIFTATARMLAEGKVIGWMQGKAEFGPRALGNRSIIADPRNPRIKDIINGKVKFREEFRPFAPSILHEYGPEYFENYQETLYMERALVFRPECRHKVPGVVHVDGTGRLQTVKKEYNERYHQLITAFHTLTGVPIILNTSFNVMGKPIIHTVEDAVATFCTTGLDALVIDDEIIIFSDQVDNTALDIVPSTFAAPIDDY